MAEIKTIDGEKLREWREAKEITQWEMAEELCITPGFLSTIESGKRGVSLETLGKIMDMTRMSADELIIPKEESDG